MISTTIRFKGELYEGVHEPIVSRALFAKTEAVRLRTHRQTGPKFKPYSYRGLFRCGECGCAITTETQKGHNYLRCTKRVNKACSQRYVREEDIAEQICNVLSGLDIPDDWFEWMLGELERHSRLAKFDAVETVRRTERQLIEVDQKIDRLTDAYVETAISLDEFRRAKNERVKEKEDLKAQLVGLKQNSDKRFEPAKEFILACKQAVFLSRGTETTKQSEMFKKIGSNPILVNRKIRFSPREAWKLVVNQGSFAQPAAARESPAADVCGETHHDFNKRREGDSKRNKCIHGREIAIGSATHE